MLIDALLPISQRAPADELCAKMRGERIHDDNFHIHALFDKIIDLFRDQHLVV